MVYTMECFGVSGLGNIANECFFSKNKIMEKESKKNRKKKGVVVFWTYNCCKTQRLEFNKMG